MSQDEIIKEVRAIREAYAEQFGFDIQAIWLDAKEQEGKSGWLVIALEPKHIPVAIERPEVQTQEPA